MPTSAVTPGEKINSSLSDSLQEPDSSKITEFEGHKFALEAVAAGSEPWPYSIEPLPDGRILLSTRGHGLKVITPGSSTAVPVAIDPLKVREINAYDFCFENKTQHGLPRGNGWMLDIATSPKPSERDTVFIAIGRTAQRNPFPKDPCPETAPSSWGPGTSMIQIIRGKLIGNELIDVKEVWAFDKRHYTKETELTLGGRITFDGAGNLLFSVGVKGAANDLPVERHKRAQDLSHPEGKIHRVQPDGKGPPADNPFNGDGGTSNLTYPCGKPQLAVLDSIYACGVRSPQGLEYDHRRQVLWQTEMGPAGGDELNLIVAGGNYGWPYATSGTPYDGPVNYAAGVDTKALHFKPPIWDFGWNGR
ncbi:PQQ-dependent sugar dehydrogenase [Bauldia sp.]|uniref:PQQ-dependent sugar dehydrogenase n=1 Tax=Bauldia sp. TaxID=2575872 RepID=UPI003BADBAA6